jgi:hypothetical protein
VQELEAEYIGFVVQVERWEQPGRAADIQLVEVQEVCTAAELAVGVGR